MRDFPPLKPLEFRFYSEDESLERVTEFADDLMRRRTVRSYSDRPVQRELIEQIIRAANSAPSGANKQPWTFVAVSDPDTKSKIREAAEEEEKVNYGGRMSEEWLEDLRPLRTTWEKEFLEIAPWLVVVFAQSYGIDPDGRKRKHYYVQESVGLACGMLLAAAHRAGLATLTHTPSPMGFLSDILGRPKNERPFLLIPIGYPSPDTHVPDIAKKSVDDISIWIE